MLSVVVGEATAMDLGTKSVAILCVLLTGSGAPQAVAGEAVPHGHALTERQAKGDGAVKSDTGVPSG